jgi:ribonucleoside-triphosphate reductase
MNPERKGKGVKFERIRRITRYLFGTLDRWNNAKKAEEKDRVKHGLGNADRCVCCGAIIPEGFMACPRCLLYVKGEDDG